MDRAHRTPLRRGLVALALTATVVVGGCASSGSPSGSATYVGRARNSGGVAPAASQDAEAVFAGAWERRPGRSERPVSDSDPARRLHDRRCGLRRAGVRRPEWCRPGVLRFGARPGPGWRRDVLALERAARLPPVDVLSRQPSRCARRRTEASRSNSSSGTGTVCCQGNARLHRRDAARRARGGPRSQWRVSAGRRQVRHSGARPHNTQPRLTGRVWFPLEDRGQVARVDGASGEIQALIEVGDPSAVEYLPVRPARASLPVRPVSGSPTPPSAQSGELIRRRTPLSI